MPTPLSADAIRPLAHRIVSERRRGGRRPSRVGELDQDRRLRRRAGGAGEREGGDETGEEAVTLHLRGGGCWSHRQTPPLPPSPERATAPLAPSRRAGLPPGIPPDLGRRGRRAAASAARDQPRRLR